MPIFLQQMKNMVLAYEDLCKQRLSQELSKAIAAFQAANVSRWQN